MKILEGTLPENKRAWHVMMPRSASMALGRSWQVALLLARAGMGDVMLPVVVPDENEATLELARERMQEALQWDGSKVKVFPFITTAAEYRREANHFIQEWNIDVLIDDFSDNINHNLNRCPCAVAGVRGDFHQPGEEGQPIKRIVVPTSGGPNTVYALTMLMPLAPDVEIVAVYIAPEHLGPNEEALGQHRLRQTLDFIDGQNVIKTQLISAPTVAEGIQEAASEGDVVVIGASRESSVDKVIFGNIPDQVVRVSKKPIVVMREPNDRLAQVLGTIFWRLQSVLPRLNVRDRTEAYVRIRRAARPSVDYYILISLSAIIAALGLMASSTAVVIGAMLVAPLMSPIVGIGLAIVLGDTRFLRLALGAVLRGTLLAIVVGMIAGLYQLGKPLTPELLSRTQPSLLDLGIAWFSGMAAAFALSRSNAAGALPGVAIAAALVPPLSTVGVSLTAGYYLESLGATLLFITNLVAISSATALVFLILGFRPAASQKARKKVRARSARVAASSLVLVAALLFGSSYFLGEQQSQRNRIHEVADQKLAEVADAELVEATIVDFSNGKLTLDIVARSTHGITFSTVQDLQAAIGEQLVNEGIIDEIALTVTVIRVTELDPLVPPTPTPGPAPTETPEPPPDPLATPAASVGSWHLL